MKKPIVNLSDSTQLEKLKNWLMILRFRCPYPTFRSESYVAYAKISEITGLSYTMVRRLVMDKLA